MMPLKIIVALTSMAISVVCATPAGAVPDDVNNDAGFLASLRQSSITFASEQQAIVAGHAVCGLVNNGESGLQVVKELQADNAGLTLDAAAKFSAIAANSYCPHQLAGAG